MASLSLHELYKRPPPIWLHPMYFGKDPGSLAEVAWELILIPLQACSVMPTWEDPTWIVVLWRPSAGGLHLTMCCRVITGAMRCRAESGPETSPVPGVICARHIQSR